MANLTLNKKQTALIYAGRSSAVEPTLGDLFVGISDYVTNSEYNVIVDAYNGLEGSIDTTTSAGFTVTGIDADNNQIQVFSHPVRPTPIHK